MLGHLDRGAALFGLQAPLETGHGVAYRSKKFQASFQLRRDAVKEFLSRHADRITGVLSGFDRLVLRGTLRHISYTDGMGKYLSYRKILLKDFTGFAQKLTADLKHCLTEQAERLSRPVVYVESTRRNKEAIAREIAERDKLQHGLIAVLSCVEPCLTFSIRRNPRLKRLELVHGFRKCLFFYHYFLDPVFGFMHARIQSWLPFNIQVCVNGREWLAIQMNQSGIRYRRRENCFPWIQDVDAAQRLLDEQLKCHWPQTLNRIAQLFNPLLPRLFPQGGVGYYWSVYQSEWATDVMFRDSSSLAEIYPALVRHGITTFSSPDVMRFLGRQVRSDFSGEIVSRFRDRPEGLRLKHAIGQNSVKIYDKQGSVLRVETTIHRPEDMRCFRPKEGQPRGPRAWRPLRRGIADLHRRASLSQASNERYLQALASCDTSSPLGQLLTPVCRTTHWNGSRVRALRPWEALDASLLAAISRGEFHLRGFRNRDLRELLFPNPTQDPSETRRRSARITRLLRILRAHGLVRKIPKTFRYRLTKRGHELCSAVLTANSLTIQQIQKAVA